MDQVNSEMPSLTRAIPFSEIIPGDLCDEFLNRDFGKRIRHFPEAAFRHCGFDLQSFVNILTSTLWPAGDINIVPNDTHKTDHNHTVKLLGTTRRLTPDVLRGVRAAKSTIQVKQIDRLHSGLREMCHRMAENGIYKCPANAYYTPSNAQGFLPHWDTHDVFLLQIAGSKCWHLAKEPTIYAPLEAPEHSVYEGYEIADEYVIELNAGEALYIPRGFGHYATALDSDSLHLTLGFKPLLWADIFKKACHQSMLDADFLRENLSDMEALDNGEYEDLAIEARKRMMAALESVDLADLIRNEMRSRTRAANKKRGEMFGSDLSDLLK